MPPPLPPSLLPCRLLHALCRVVLFYAVFCCAVGGPRPVVPYAVPPPPARHGVGGVQGHVGAGGGQRLPLRVRRGLRFLGLPPLLRPPVSQTSS